MASVLSSFFSRDPKANFPYELPTETFFQKDGCSMGNSFKKVFFFILSIQFSISESQLKSTTILLFFDLCNFILV